MCPLKSSTRLEREVFIVLLSIGCRVCPTMIAQMRRALSHIIVERVSATEGAPLACPFNVPPRCAFRKNVRTIALPQYGAISAGAALALVGSRIHLSFG
jgi:hypothetical protein